MALVVKDRVQEVTTTAGTGTIALGGAVLGFQSFATIGNGNTTYYTINDPITGDWEVGIGTYTSAGPSLSRDTVLSSSSGGTLVSFAAGSKNVFVTYPSERSVYLDSPGSYPVQNTFNALSATTATLTAGTITTPPSAGTDIVNKDYADSIASGLNYHQPVNYASVAALPSYVYNNGTLGVNATITASANGALSFGGGSPTAGQRLLVKDETGGNAPYNGVYTVTNTGSPSAKFILTRATDYDSSGTGTNEVDAGDYVLVISGTNASTAWVQQTPLPIVIGTTALTFLQFNAPITYSAGTGLNLSPATTFNISNTGVTAATYGSASQVPVFAVNAQGQITSVTNTAIAIAAGAVSGLAASATTDTTNATNITSGTLPSGRLSGSYTGITGVGTLTAGTWNGSVIGPVYGGTGFGTYAVGDLLYADTTTSLAKLADVAVGNALISGGVGSAPSWGKIGLATHTSGILPIANGGTNTSATATNGGITYGTGTAYAFTAAGTSGQVLQSNGAAAPTWVNLSTLGVSSFSAGTTGLTPSTATSGAVTLAGTLNVANGGSGATTAQGAMNAFAGAVTSGYYLRGNGTNVVMSAIQAADIPSLSATYLPLAGGTMTGAIVVSSTSVGAQFGNLSVGYGGAYNTLQTKDGTSSLYLQYASTGTIDIGTGGGYTTINQSTRSPIFYDSNNTAYYVDPASASNIGSWTSTSAINVQTGTGASVYQQITNTDAAGTYAYLQLTASGAGSGYLIKNRTTGNSMTNQSLYLWNDPGPIEFVPSGNQALRTTISTGGSMTVATDIRAPIFYDSNNTGYYVDPASTSNLNGVLTSSAVSDNNTGLRNVLPGGGSYVSTASSVTGAIQITLPTTNYPMVRFTVKVYTYDNLSFEISCGGHTSGGTWYNTFAYMSTQNRAALNVRFCYGGGQTFVYIGELGSTWYYPQVFITDVQVGYQTYSASQWNTGWVVAFNSSTYNSVSSTHTVYPPTSSSNNTNPAYASIFYDSNDTTYYVDPNSISSLFGVAIRGDQSSTGTSNQLFLWGTGNNTTSAIGFKANAGYFPNPTGAGDGYNTYLTMDTDGRGWVFRRGVGGTDFGAANTSGWILNNGLWQANASMRAPIFYDSNDTGYYIDPASTSNSALRMRGGALFGPNTTWSAYLAVGTNGNTNTAYASVAATNGNLHMDAASGYDMYLNYYAGSNVFFGNGASGGIYAQVASDGSFRSPIYYDYQNTAYYVDPASTSNINQLNMNGPIVRTVSGQGYLNGNYPSSETVATSGAIYSIGGAYVPGTTTLNNMYGVGYTYTGPGRAVGNPAGAPSDLWGLYGAAAGTANWFLDATNGRGYFASQVNATIFYDANNTGYYLDPAGTSVLNTATINGVWSFTAASNCIYAYGNGNTGAVSSVGLQVFSTGGAGATMAFHRGGYYAVNFGLDSDNVLRIGGWSASASRWQLDMSGNNYIAGDFYAGNNVRIGKGNNFVATNTAVGVSALASVNSNYHTAVGYNALQGMTTYTNPIYAIAGGSTAVGYGALQSNVGNPTIGSGNTAIGSGAMYNATGAYLCTTVGAYAGFNLTNANSTTIVGNLAGWTMVNNSNCVAIGYAALQNYSSNTATGNSTIAIGAYAGQHSYGSNSVLVGTNVLYNANTNGVTSCTFIGHSVMYSQTNTSAQCTFIGGSSMVSYDGIITNSSTLGYGTEVTGNNQVQLGNASTTTYVYGTVQNRSDARDKADIRDTQLGLDFIEALRPVDFRWDYRDSYVDLIESEDEDGNDTSTRVEHPKDGSRKRSRYHHGLIAQEVKEMLDAKGIDFGGYQDHSVAGGKDVLTIGYDELVGPLIKAVQELSNQVKALSSELADLKAKF